MTSTELSATDWRPWFDTYGARLLLVARQWTRSLADAEDVVQDAFMRFWRNQRHLGGDPMPLLVTSVRRAALDLHRSRDRRERREHEHVGLESDAWFTPSFEEDERRTELEQSVRQLPGEQREVVILKIWGGLTFAQIAEQLDLSPNTAASRYRYALSHLREKLNGVENHG